MRIRSIQLTGFFAVHKYRAVFVAWSKAQLMFKKYYPLFILVCLHALVYGQKLGDGVFAGVRVAHFNNVGPASDTYAPFRYGDKIYFTTTYKNSLRVFSDAAAGNSDDMSNAALLTFNAAKEGWHTSNLIIAPDGKMMYYTLCEDEGGKNCTIWSRRKSYDGGWETALKLPPHINLRNTTSTQPTIGYDWSKKKYVLYFVSDRSGGQGGMDLWCSLIEQDGTYGIPEPLPFNTDMDEITPYFHLTEKTLFFSSNGRGGIGGFDVFSCLLLSTGGWEEPINQGAVINSVFDESYFTFHASSKKGYFASNRPILGGHRDGTSKSRFKVFEIEPVVELTLPVFSARNMAMVHNATAYVYDESTGQKQVFTEGPFDRNLVVTLLPGRTYRVAVVKDGYLPTVIETSTEGVVFPVSFINEVQLFEGEAVPEENWEKFGLKEKALKVKLTGSGVEDSDFKKELQSSIELDLGN